jgi:Uma2 family endonuclease
MRFIECTAFIGSPRRRLREHRTGGGWVKTKPQWRCADDVPPPVRDDLACYPCFVSTIDRLADLGTERVRPLRRVEFERLVHDGLFDDERVELLGGAIVEISPQDPRHAATVERLYRALSRTIGTYASVRVQLPFVASDDSLPEPDVAVVPLRDYDDGHPDRAFLVAEVASSSLRKDRSLKVDLYARAGVPEYWIVNVEERQIEVLSSPREGAYSATAIARAGDSLRLATLDGAAVDVSDVLR